MWVSSVHTDLVPDRFLAWRIWCSEALQLCFVNMYCSCSRIKNHGDALAVSAIKFMAGTFINVIHGKLLYTI